MDKELAINKNKINNLNNSLFSLVMFLTLERKQKNLPSALNSRLNRSIYFIQETKLKLQRCPPAPKYISGKTLSEL